MKKLIPFIMGRYLNTMARFSARTSGAHGFRLFCYPFRPPLKHHHKKFLLAGAYSRMRINETDIQLYRWGHGKKNLLLLHGWQSHSYRWKNYVETLPLDEYTVYSLDAPGHGLSSGNFLTVPVYSTVIENFILSIGTFDAIIAHSLGAFTTLFTLSRLPFLPVKKVVLLASPGQATEFIQFYKETLKLSDHSVNHIINHFEDVITFPVEYFSAPKFAASLRQPGLIIHDEEDDETSYKHSVSIHQAWERSELVVTKGLGHNLKSGEVLRRIVDFVKNVPVTASPRD